MKGFGNITMVLIVSIAVFNAVISIDKSPKSDTDKKYSGIEYNSSNVELSVSRIDYNKTHGIYKVNVSYLGDRPYLIAGIKAFSHPEGENFPLKYEEDVWLSDMQERNDTWIGNLTLDRGDKFDIYQLEVLDWNKCPNGEMAYFCYESDVEPGMENPEFLFKQHEDSGLKIRTTEIDKKTGESE